MSYTMDGHSISQCVCVMSHTFNYVFPIYMHPAASSLMLYVTIYIFILLIIVPLIKIVWIVKQ